MERISEMTDGWLVTKWGTRQVSGHERVLGMQPKIPVPGLADCTDRKGKSQHFVENDCEKHMLNSESEFEEAPLALFYLHAT